MAAPDLEDRVAELEKQVQDLADLLGSAVENIAGDVNEYIGYSVTATWDTSIDDPGTEDAETVSLWQFQSHLPVKARA